MHYRADWGLRLRMLAVFAVLAGLYAALAGWIGRGLPGLAIATLAAIGLIAAQYLYSDAVTLRALDAERVDPGAFPDVHARLDRLAQQADTAKPDLAVIDSATPNALATGTPASPGS